jgi:tetratricopeptide (TPR) repeat protein
MLIDTYERLGMIREAAQLRDRYGQIKMDLQVEGLFKEALRAVARQDLETAVVKYKKALEMDPNNAVFHSNLGYIYFDIGLSGLALEEQKKALEINPDMANAHYGLALIYTKTGRLDLAKTHWKEYLRISPSGYYSRKAEHELRSLEEKADK